MEELDVVWGGKKKKKKKKKKTCRSGIVVSLYIYILLYMFLLQKKFRVGSRFC